MAGPVSAEQAIAFVRSKGGPLDNALLKVLLHEHLTDEDLAVLTEAQNPDGGFRVSQLQTKQSVVGRTAEMLLYLAVLGAEEFGSAQAAADFLIEHQTPGGTWEEPESLRTASPPPHFSPGSADVAGWETAAAVVALTGIGLSLDFHSALEWLRSHRVHAGGSRAFNLELFLAHAAFWKLEGPASKATESLAVELETLSKKDLEVFELNWALLSAAAVRMPASHPLVGAFAGQLARHQREGGGFGSGPQPSGYETVLALRSLEHAEIVRLPRGTRASSAEPDPANSDHTM